MTTTIAHDTEARKPSPMLQSTIKRQTLKAVIFLVLKTLLTTGIAFGAQLVLGATLDASAYGMYGIVVTIAGFFTIISDVGLAASLIQQKDEPSLLELRTAFSVQQLLSWVVFSLICITAYFLFRVERLSFDGFWLAVVFGLSFPIVSLKTISSILLERSLSFDRIVIPSILETLVFNLVVIVLAVRGFGVSSFTYAVLAKAVVGVVVMFLLKRWKIGFAFSWKTFRSLMKIGGAFQLNDMLAKAKDDVFYITVALLIPVEKFGLITWARQWSRFPYTFTVDTITAITFPAYSRIQHDRQLLAKAIEKTIFFITIFSFPLFFGMAVMARPFLEVIPRYSRWEEALPSLALFSISLAFASFSTPLISTLNAIGKIAESLRMMMFWTVAQWALFPILFPWFNFESVAMISIILAFTSLYVISLVHRHVSFNFLGSIWVQTVATVGMSVLLLLSGPIWSQSLGHFIAGIFCGGLLYVLLLCLLGFEKIKNEVYSLLKR